MITLSIDLRLIDQSRCKKITRKNGQPATFCDIVLIETPNSDYGDFVAKQDSTKIERESGAQTPILGNAKIREKKQGPFPKRAPSQSDPDDDSDSIPF